jgi:hypothetical protein
LKVFFGLIVFAVGYTLKMGRGPQGGCAAWRIHRAERTAPARYRADLANILHYLHGVQLPARR